MNPYPFAPLNHLTVPFSLTAKTPFASVRMKSPLCLLTRREKGCCSAGFYRNGKRLLKRSLPQLCRVPQPFRFRSSHHTTPTQESPEIPVGATDNIQELRWL